jgi:xanthine dehydrogenase YagR molybdenum-binding subunit
MASWPENPRLINSEYPRLDGLIKATGKAEYPSDVHPEGMLFAAVLYSPHAHAKITRLDTSKAEGAKGVRAIHLFVKEGDTVRFQGDDIAAVAADTEELARDGVRAIEIEYEVLPHVVIEEESMKESAPKLSNRGNVQKGRAQEEGNPDEAMGKAEVTIEATYSLPVITHVCLEPHGLTAAWEGEKKAKAWASTQNVGGVANDIAQRFEIPVGDVHAITEVMGGGFGSKFGADAWGLAAAELSKKAGKPVKLFLDRAQEHMAAGNRPSATGRIKLGAGKDGKLVAMLADTHGTGGITSGAAGFPFPYVYHVPAYRREHANVFVNAGNARAMRAPGHPQACALMEAAMDDLAEKIGMDPLEFRLKNLPEGDFKTPIYRGEVEQGAKAIGWERRKSREENRKAEGPVKRGLGMALHTWGGRGVPGKQVNCIINPDGSVEIRSATQDIGTGTRTILAMITAEALGLQPTDINSNIGDSIFPPGQASGGSTTAPSMSPPCWDAALKARDELFSRVGKKINEDPKAMSLKDGQLLVRGEPVMSWKDACRKLEMMPVSVIGEFQEGLSSEGVGGCQFAEVTVDVETGVVRLKKIVAVQDSGLIVNKLTWRSQVYGGIVGGLNYGLFEERVMDPTTGIFLNPDMEMYKIAGPSDMPEIEAIAYEPDDQKARGVIGIGEPPTIATAAAIANAVANAAGVRVPNWPMSPMNVLNALTSAKKEG